jgi:hypothetical protein
VKELPTAHASFREGELTPESVLPFEPISGLGTTFHAPHAGADAKPEADGSSVVAIAAASITMERRPRRIRYAFMVPSRWKRLSLSTQTRTAGLAASQPLRSMRLLPTAHRVEPTLATAHSPVPAMPGTGSVCHAAPFQN